MKRSSQALASSASWVHFSHLNFQHRLRFSQSTSDVFCTSKEIVFIFKTFPEGIKLEFREISFNLLLQTHHCWAIFLHSFAIFPISPLSHLNFLHDWKLLNLSQTSLIAFPIVDSTWMGEKISCVKIVSISIEQRSQLVSTHFDRFSSSISRLRRRM